MTPLKKLMQHHNLNHDEMAELTQIMFNPEIDDSEKVAYLVALKMKEETTLELTSLVKEIIKRQYPVQPQLKDSICVCGTGGDHSGSFNISTTVSFVIAAAGLNVVKHGNKSITSKTGSVDILEALNIRTTPFHAVEESLKKSNLQFLSATETYPDMKLIQQVRKRIPVPTIFNLAGPLIHPYQLEYQVMGVYDGTKAKAIAETLFNLGRKRAIVVHGAGGMDEATLSGENMIYKVDRTHGITHYTISAEQFGLQTAENGALKGDDKYLNADITKNILKGIEQGPKRDVVLLNAGLALYTSNTTPNIQQGIERARYLIDSGAAYKILTGKAER